MSPTRHRIIIAAALVLSASVALLALSLHGRGPLPIDLGLARWLQALLPYPSRGGLLLASASRLIWILAGALVLGFALLRWWSALGFGVGVTISGYALADGLLKRLVARPRPTADLVRLYRPDVGFSFPSATSLAALVACGCALYLWQMRRPPHRRLLHVASAGLASGVVVLIGASRVYVGAHWPSDIVGGWLMGGAWLLWLIGGRAWWQQRGR
jgi:undecaprenyl-diphosphatase